MKYKLSIGILVLLVCLIMMIPNGLASPGPPVWVNQVTISTIDNRISQDPEISGFAADIVVVWEEWNGADWDVMMKYNNFNGAPLMWIFSLVPPAGTAADEINPAVAMARIHPMTGPEVHVVYQRWNGVNWEICHTWSLFWGAPWTPPFVISTPGLDAIDPAIVYTESLLNPGPGNPGMLMQMVWAEETFGGSGLYQIQYEAFYFDPFLAPMRGYVGITTVSAAPANCTCMYPEIASVDEDSPFRILTIDYDFSVVWQETNPAGQWNIWYNDGTTRTSPGPLPPSTAVTIGSLGQLNPVTLTDDCTVPDIAASQDYQNAFGLMIYYFHVDWRRVNTSSGNNFIESCYAIGAASTPGSLSFAMVLPPAQGPTLSTLDNPTVGSKLIALNPSVFETWMAWEDSTNPGATIPDIWYSVGTCTVAGGFVYNLGGPPWRVGYVPGVGMGSVENNPELWNRNDWNTWFPVQTHLAFDQTIAPAVIPEVIYIDP